MLRKQTQTDGEAVWLARSLPRIDTGGYIWYPCHSLPYRDDAKLTCMQIQIKWFRWISPLKRLNEYGQRERERARKCWRWWCCRSRCKLRCDSLIMLWIGSAASFRHHTLTTFHIFLRFMIKHILSYTVLRERHDGMYVCICILLYIIQVYDMYTYVST